MISDGFRFTEKPRVGWFWTYVTLCPVPAGITADLIEFAVLRIGGGSADQESGGM